MTTELWFIFFGLLLVLMALAGSVFKRLPVSASLVYLGLGYAGSRFGVVFVDPKDTSRTLEHLAELAVIVSLFCSGLKLRLPLRNSAWQLPVRLAAAGMVITVALGTGLGLALGLPLGAAILLAAVLSPTDPVLASDVQVDRPTDRDKLRFALTGEAGLNDGTAFPFVMLGLGILGVHELGPLGGRWLAFDVVWAISAGGLIGWLLGAGVGRLVLYMRRVHREAVGLDDFLALGLIALSYGAAVLLNAYGFIAVFAAGIALVRAERHKPAGTLSAEVSAAAASGHTEEIATAHATAPAYMASAVLGFTEQMERIGEVVLMLLVGVMLGRVGLSVEGFIFAAALMLVLRPVTVGLVTLRSNVTLRQRALMGWFGIRGIGSLYYLFYAMNHGLNPALADRLIPIVLTVVACSAVVHGISVTPLMSRYRRSNEEDISIGPTLR